MAGRSKPPPGFIGGEHYHDPRDPGVYYPPKVIGKALHKRAKPNPSKKVRVYKTYGGTWRPRIPGENVKGAPSKLVTLTSLEKQCPRKGMRGYSRRHKNPGWYIHIQKSGRGPVMLWNGRSFTNRPDERPMPFTSQNAAMYKARHLLGKFHRQLSAYKIWVSDQFFGIPAPSRRVNPALRAARKLDVAARKLEDFTGRPATEVVRASESEDKTGLVLGEMDQIDYRAAREGVEGGRMVRYRHKFRKGSRPLLAVSSDGKQLRVVGGQYEFTEAGIEDR